MKPPNIKGGNKDVKIYVGGGGGGFNGLLFRTRKLYINYVIKTFLLLSSSVRR